LKTIGILGGLGPESTLSYYSYITRKYYEMRGDYAYPEIVIYSVNFQEYIDLGYEAAPAVETAIRKLHRAGADFVVAACNSIHIVYDEVCPRVPIPWVSIMDVAAEEIRERRMRRVGLLGTIFTMGKGFYQRGLARHGIETITPRAEVQRRLNRIIYGELVRNVVTRDSKRFVLQAIADLSKAGAQGVVLGCTELPFVASQEDTRVPLFDTTALHAQRALELAVGVRRLPPARPRKDRRPFRRARGGPESDRMGRR